jgi:SAM-dependent methyltransferase
MSAYSAFSDVDAAADPSRLVRSLEESARGLAAMKSYMAATLAAHARDGLVLDVGCGSGHDLVALEATHVRAVGVDPSRVMVDAAARITTTGSPLVQAVGAPLPFRSGAFAGCWIERVLMHVADPLAVLREVVRCVRPGGVVTIFEPDWSSLTVNGQVLPTAWTTTARQPSIGAEVGGLLASLGCFVRDRVEERSWWTREQFEAITRRPLVSMSVDLADADAPFDAHIVKVLWVATTPDGPVGTPPPPAAPSSTPRT